LVGFAAKKFTPTSPARPSHSRWPSRASATNTTFCATTTSSPSAGTTDAGAKTVSVSPVIHSGLMSEVPIRELRNHGSEVIDRVRRGERVTVTRDGEPVAELRQLPRRRLSAAALIEQYRSLPRVDPDRLRADIDATIDQSL
jgi:antitoxin (DNA-binding transcriptional repressor) of toxin-antitoxin stability system